MSNHPPCDQSHHTSGGRECGQARCPFCGEIYDMGQKFSRPAGYHWWPDGEAMYWKHCRTSEKHQLVLEIYALNTAHLLHRIDTSWNDMRAHNKLYQSEERKRLHHALI